MSELQRENRYYVIKRSDLKAAPVYLQVEFELAVEKLLPHLPVRECLTIESDWPEYEPAWAAIEARVAGSPLKAGQGEAVAWSYREYLWVTGLGGSVWREKLEAECPDHDDQNIKDIAPLYTAPPASADAVSVPRELLETLLIGHLLGVGHKAAKQELRALLAQSQEVKP